ncbi:patatin-like serine [Zalerion maritima]|uniref:Lysophospholipase NTE1 n=1 Tax=Zalerion maritima TaxID=339359 RepID=A0AAD5RG56_9PEZI|nr:patatin-like serine [Zalerion maritima]
MKGFDWNWSENLPLARKLFSSCFCGLLASNKSPEAAHVDRGQAYKTIRSHAFLQNVNNITFPKIPTAPPHTSTPPIFIILTPAILKVYNHEPSRLIPNLGPTSSWLCHTKRDYLASLGFIHMTPMILAVEHNNAPKFPGTFSWRLLRSYSKMDSSSVETAIKASSSVIQAVSSAMAESSPAGAAELNGTASEVAATAVESSSWLGLLGKLVLFSLHFISTILYWALKLTTISTPTLLFTIFSTSLTVTMNATTLLLIIAAMMGAITWFVRYRYLNMYSRLPPEPQRKEPEIDLFPDTHDEGTKAGLSSYLDEFLSAIKIFGYLERPVFHELTRSMQTRKLIAGETWNLEEEKGFCIVVDGLVEIFVKSSRDRQPTASSRPFAATAESSFSEEDDHPEPGTQKYQLLTEVGNGVPMSSLFSIMSLFTEDINLRRPDDDNSEPPTAGGGVEHPRFATNPDYMRSEEDLSFPSSPRREDGPDHSSALVPISASRRLPPFALDTSGHQHHTTRPVPKRASTSSVHPDLIARATVDTTIAIVPASAFRRLIKVYPKATAHVVHVILSRFQRVTLATAYNYLGLSGEVLQTEMSMINYTMYQLPNFLRGDALERLKEKFKRELERIGRDEGGKGIALHNAGAVRRQRSSTGLRKEAMLQTMSKQRHSSVVASPIAPLKERFSIDTPSPGDLLSNIQISRAGANKSPASQMNPSSATQALHTHDALKRDGASPLAQRTFNPFATPTHGRVSIDPRESIDEDNTFRACILECIFKAIGLGGGSSPKDVESKEASPRLGAFDRRRQNFPATTTNAFGSMGPLDMTGDDTESMTSAGIAVNAALNEHVLANEMKEEVEIVFFPKGSVLVEQGERNPGLYYVIDGFLDICIPTEGDVREDMFSPFHSGSAASVPEPPFARTPKPGPQAQAEGKKKGGASRASVGLIKPGGLAGYIGTVSSYRSFIDVVAKTDVYVGFLPRAVLERFVEKYPIVLLTMAKRLTSLLPRLISHIDFALEWVQVNASQVLYHAGDESDAIYLVLNGRLRLVEDRKDGGVNVRAEYGQGDSVGELEVLTESSRSGTLHAIRDTELVKFPRSLFNSLAKEHPNITIKISKIIASRMRALVDGAPKSTGQEIAGSKGTSTLNLRTVAVLPVTSGVPVVEFGNRLMAALTQVGPPNGATSLNQAAILNHLGKHAFNKMGKLKLSQYLADLEEKYGLVVYVADTNVTSPWTQTCIAQADCILLVGLAEGSPEVGEYERFLLGMKSTARKILILLHAERYSQPGLTRSWLKNRVWVNGGHYHIQMAFRTNTVPVNPPTSRFGAAFKERVQIIQAEIQKYTSRKVHHSPFYSPEAPFKGDFHRLARRLCGRSIGLVLGGGGARGISQIGIIRAMEDAGVPIDMVGGTSIGAFIGALYARHADLVPIFGLVKKFAGRMASMWRFALDLTYPSASYTTGHEFNRGIFKTFGKSQIEDFWLEYYCNTTNISKSRQEFHTSGYAWRYVRASMSLAGLLPPLCDEGSMLLDGGYIDNLTVSHMKSMGVDTIFAVDVGALDDDTPQSFGDSLSGIWAFFNRWNPFSSHPNPPTLAEIQGRLAYVSSVDALERAKTMAGCFYMRPPVDDYGTLDFGKFDEIYELGYKFGKEFLQKLRENGSLPLIEETEAKKALRRTMAPRRASI